MYATEYSQISEESIYEEVYSQSDLNRLTNIIPDQPINIQDSYVIPPQYSSSLNSSHRLCPQMTQFQQEALIKINQQAQHIVELEQKNYYYRSQCLKVIEENGVIRESIKKMQELLKNKDERIDKMEMEREGKDAMSMQRVKKMEQQLKYKDKCIQQLKHKILKEQLRQKQKERERQMQKHRYQILQKERQKQRYKQRQRQKQREKQYERLKLRQRQKERQIEMFLQKQRQRQKERQRERQKERQRQRQKGRQRQKEKERQKERGQQRQRQRQRQRRIEAQAKLSKDQHKHPNNFLPHTLITKELLHQQKLIVQLCAKNQELVKINSYLQHQLKLSQDKLVKMQIQIQDKLCLMFTDKFTKLKQNSLSIRNDKQTVNFNSKKQRHANNNADKQYKTLQKYNFGTKDRELSKNDIQLKFDKLKPIDDPKPYRKMNNSNQLQEIKRKYFQF